MLLMRNILNLLHNLNSINRYLRKSTSSLPPFRPSIEAKKIFLGDSVYLRVSKSDKIKISIADAIRQNYVDSYVYAHSALSTVHYYALLLSSNNIIQEADRVVIPINYRSFSPQWEFNPAYQYKSDLIAIQNSLASGAQILSSLFERQAPEMSEYYHYGSKSSRFFDQARPHTLESISETLERRRKIFAYHYLFDTKMIINSGRYEAIKHIAELFGDHKAKLAFIILPINYQAVEFLFDEGAVAYLRSNIRRFLDLTNEMGAIIVDYSNAASRMDFFSFMEPTEHLNENGRAILMTGLSKLAE